MAWMAELVWCRLFERLSLLNDIQQFYPHGANLLVYLNGVSLDAIFLLPLLKADLRIAQIDASRDHFRSFNRASLWD